MPVCARVVGAISAKVSIRPNVSASAASFVAGVRVKAFPNVVRSHDGVTGRAVEVAAARPQSAQGGSLTNTYICL